MAQDLGLHEDPRFLVDEDKTISPVEDFHLRRRVYWGCYIADKHVHIQFYSPLTLTDP